MTLAAFSFGPGCQTRCTIDFDCATGSFCSADGVCTTECFTDLDCREPPECQNNPTACVPKGLFCNSMGRCTGSFSINRMPVVRPPMDNGNPTVIDGWDEPPASGKAFIVNTIAIAEKDRGFDLNGDCDQSTGKGCVDNILWQLGELGNDQIRQGLLGGESLLLIELAGLIDPYHGDDKSLTVKIYGARDAADPFFPAADFKVPPGHTTCCEFKINPQSLITGPPQQARARAPARIERGRMFSLAPVPIQFTLTVGAPPHPEIRLERVLVTARIPETVNETMPGALGIDEGLLGGAVPISTLAQTENPYCKTVSPRCTIQFTDSTLIDLVATLLSPTPDIDLSIPLNGLDEVLDTDGDGRIDLCCESNGMMPAAINNVCTKAAAPSIDPAPDKKWQCALNPDIQDGYSVAITFTAVQARIVGIGQ
jgi:hypothetical protein